MMKNGKMIEIIDYLCKKGLKFYTGCPSSWKHFENGMTYKFWEGLNGVTHLGLLPRMEYLQLLKDSKFMLGLGQPAMTNNNLEALYYKTPIIAPLMQYPPYHLSKSPNCYAIERNVKEGLNEENMEKLFTLLKNIEFDENDPIRDEECDVEAYNKRLDEIFK